MTLHFPLTWLVDKADAACCCAAAAYSLSVVSSAVTACVTRHHPARFEDDFQLLPHAADAADVCRAPE